MISGVGQPELRLPSFDIGQARSKSPHRLDLELPYLPAHVLSRDSLLGALLLSGHFSLKIWTIGSKSAINDLVYAASREARMVSNSRRRFITQPII
jgi:hypothetical protein